MKTNEAKELKKGAKLFCKFHTPSEMVVLFERLIDSRRILVRTQEGKLKIRAIQTLTASKTY